MTQGLARRSWTGLDPVEQKAEAAARTCWVIPQGLQLVGHELADALHGALEERGTHGGAGPMCSENRVGGGSRDSSTRHSRRSADQLPARSEPNRATRATGNPHFSSPPRSSAHTRFWLSLSITLPLTISLFLFLFLSRRRRTIIYRRSYMSIQSSSVNKPFERIMSSCIRSICSIVGKFKLSRVGRLLSHQLADTHMRLAPFSTLLGRSCIRMRN